MAEQESKKAWWLVRAYAAPTRLDALNGIRAAAGRRPLDAWPAELKSSRHDMGIRSIVQISWKLGCLGPLVHLGVEIDGGALEHQHRVGRGGVHVIVEGVQVRPVHCVGGVGEPHQ